MVVGSPNAPELSPLTTLPVPTEIDCSPVACALLPIAMALTAFVLAPLPIATLSFASVAVLLESPIDIELLPSAVAKAHCANDAHPFACAL